MYPFIKRGMDIFFVILFLPLWLPVMVVLAVLVTTTSRGGIFFKQQRFGKNQRLFSIYKFRSMKINTPKDVPTDQLANPQQYITKVGRVLRKLSLDELPQLINILKGDMSLVGPRPALYNQLDLIALREKNGSNAVPVGLTGLAQIKGRDELPLEEKAAYDGEYARRMGFLFDIKILLATVFKAISGSGVKVN